MKFVVVTYGTEGDARPLTALCRALIDAGHEARLLADGGTLGLARELGVPSTALAGDITGRIDPANAIANVVGERGGAGAMARALAKIANSHSSAWLEATVDAGQGCDAIIASGLTAFIGLSAAEELRIPAIGTMLIPITPTSDFASPFLPPRRLPRFLNRATHQLVNALVWRAFRDATNTARERVCGLPPLKTLPSSHPMLYGVSPALVPRPKDWPSNVHVCGQWTPPMKDWTPPENLTELLAAGEPPVYVGFGSMAGFDTDRLLREIVAAVGHRRALFYPGWSGIDAACLPPNFHVIGDTRHDWLFPQTALVIHHGGSGTTHSAARAGVPSIVLPFAGDQFFWADRILEAGIAREIVPGKSVRADALARAIAFAETPESRLRAHDLGDRMRGEDDTATTARLIERLVASRR